MKWVEQVCLEPARKLQVTLQAYIQEDQARLLN